jgi:hypothetical protein
MRNETSTLDWDGAVLGCLTPDLCSVDACDIGANQLDDPVLAGKGGTVPAVASILTEFRDILRTEIPGGLPLERVRADGAKIEHTIETPPDVTPYSRPPRPFTADESAETRRDLQDLLEKGWIVPSLSPWAAPFCSWPRNVIRSLELAPGVCALAMSSLILKH